MLVDRLVVSPDIRSRLADSIEICYREGQGEAILEFPDPASRSGASSASSAAHAAAHPGADRERREPIRRGR